MVIGDAVIVKEVAPVFPVVVLSVFQSTEDVSVGLYVYTAAYTRHSKTARSAPAPGSCSQHRPVIDCSSHTSSRRPSCNHMQLSESVLVALHVSKEMHEHGA